MEIGISAQIQLTAENLYKNGFKSSVFMNVDDACAAAMNYIGFDSVGIGGSMTVFQLDLLSQLKTNGNNVDWHWMAPEGDAETIRRRAAADDVYLCSSNAVTLGGSLVNIDGRANRIAAMLYGPKRTLVIVGRNKICADVPSAIERIKREACGKNARRLNLATPCAKTDVCADCNSPERQCRATLILERPPMDREITVFIINEDLGY